MSLMPERTSTRRRALALLAAGIGAPLATTLDLPGGRVRAQTATPASGNAASPVVLVHGSFLGAWCWDEVIPLLSAAGREVAAPDLPGHGDDQTPIAELTLQSYVDRVLETFDAFSTPVVLVGHSLGGAVLSEVAQQRPEAIARLVYLAGYLLRDGESLLDAALRDGDSLLAPKFQADQTAGVGTVAADDFAALFFHDCPPELTERAMARVRPEPLAPLATPVAISEEVFGQAPRTYIETLVDRVASPSLQRRMQAAVPGSRVAAMATGHAPFFARPGELASLITLL